MIRKFKLLAIIAPILIGGPAICQANNLDIDVTGSVKTAYDSNITYSSNDRLGDFITNLETGLILNQQGETHQFSLQTDITEQIFAEHSNFDNTAEDLKLDFKQAFSQYDRLELTDSLNHAYDPISFDDAFGRVTGRYGTLNNQTGVSYTHDFTEQLSGEVHYDDTLVDNTSNGPVNSVLYQGGTKINYTYDSANIFNVSYDYFRRLFENGPGATINSLLTGIRHYFTSQLYTDLGAGPDFISSFNGKNSIEPHYTAALTDQVNTNDRLSLTYEKQDSTDNYTEDFFNSWRTALNLDRQISQRLNSYTSIFYGQGRYDELDVSEKFTGVQTQLNYSITPKTKLSLGYAFSDSASKNSGYGYLKNYVFFSITIKF